MNNIHPLLFLCIRLAARVRARPEFAITDLPRIFINKRFINNLLFVHPITVYYNHQKEVEKMLGFIVAVLAWMFCGVMALHDYNVNGLIRGYAVLFALGTSALPLVGMLCGKIF
jgi:hypothetical protein